MNKVFYELGNQKIRTVLYIIDHLNEDDLLGTTQQEIAKEAGVSLVTVSGVIMHLRKRGVLTKVRNGVYYADSALYSLRQTGGHYE